MLDTVNHNIAIASLVAVAVYLIYLVRSGMWRDIIAPQNMERSHRYLASTIVATAVFGIATVLIMYFGANKIISGLVVALMLVGLVVEVAPGTLLKPAKKLDEADDVLDK